MNRRELLKGMIVAATGGAAADGAVADDPLTRSQLYRRMLKERVLSANEIRRKENMNPRSWDYDNATWSANQSIPK